MSGDLTIRKTKTAFGATTIQVVQHDGKRRIVIKHIGSIHNASEYHTTSTLERRARFNASDGGEIGKSKAR